MPTTLGCLIILSILSKFLVQIRSSVTLAGLWFVLGELCETADVAQKELDRINKIAIGLLR